MAYTRHMYQIMSKQVQDKATYIRHIYQVMSKHDGAGIFQEFPGSLSLSFHQSWDEDWGGWVGGWVGSSAC